MKEHIKLRQEYARLVKAGKLSEAQVLIRKMQNRENLVINNKINNMSKDINKEILVESTENEKRETFVELKDLLVIKGVGKKTIEDIEMMFDSIEDLKKSLREDRVALRDDIVEKLKKRLIG